MGEIAPPAPGTGASTAFSRDFESRIPVTAKDTDPLFESNKAIAINKTRADFDPLLFDTAIQQHGKRILWRKAMICPCIVEATGQARTDCRNCDSSGFLYVDPIAIQALIMSFDKQTRLYEKFALWQTGEASLTMQANYRMGYRDSIELIDDVACFNEIIKKGNRRGRLQDLPANTDACRYRMAAIAKVISVDGDKVISAEHGLHYELNEHGHIRWTAAGNKLIALGAYVSIHYDHHPVYLVNSHPHMMRSDIKGTKEPREVAQPLPLQVGIQLDFLAESQSLLPTTGGC